MNIFRCPGEQAEQWNDFVARHNGMYYHCYEWLNALKQGYGLKVFPLRFEENGEWKAILPVALLPWPLHKKAVSLPFSSCAGILPAPSDELLASLAAWMREKGIRSLQLRHLGDTDDGVSPDVTMIGRLPATAEELYASWSYNTRREVTIGRKNGLETHWGKEGLDTFYAVYAANMGRLGSPVHARKFIQMIQSSFKEKAKILTVSYKGQGIGGMLLMRWRETWAVPFASTLWQYRGLQPSRFMYYEAISAAIRDGARFFDFGRSRRNSGTWEFKRRMKAEERTLHYITLYSDGRRTTAGGTRAYYGKAGQTAAMCWRLLPAKLQNTLGPFIHKFVP